MQYDNYGNLKSLTASISSSEAISGVVEYEYDGRDQLTLESSYRNQNRIKHDNNFIYDDAGNPTTFRNATYGYNQNNQKTGFTFDDNGNPTGYRSGIGLEYDSNDSMKKFLSGGLTILESGYDGSGKRAWKLASGSKKYYLYSGDVPVCEMDASGNITAVNTFGPYGLLSRYQDSTDYFYTFDPQGNVVQVINSTPQVVATMAYDAYGQPLNGSSTNPTPYGYGGQAGYYTDAETNLILATYRYYDSAEGRWINRDPIGYAGGMNLYAYCSNNPVNYLDPLGLCGDGWGEEFRGLGNGLWDTITFQDLGRFMRSYFDAIAKGDLPAMAINAMNAYQGVVTMLHPELQPPPDLNMTCYEHGRMIGSQLGSLALAYAGAKAVDIPSSPCFIAGTPVVTPFDEKPIEQLEVGDSVWSFDEETEKTASGMPETNNTVDVLNKDMQIIGNARLADLTSGTRICFKGRVYDLKDGQNSDLLTLENTGIVSSKVVRTFVRKSDALIDLKVCAEDNTELVISGTPEHPFYVPAINGYVAMGKLTPGTALKTADCSMVTVVGSKIRYGSFDVYNIEVENQHNYYVSADDVLVHNDCRVPSAKLRAMWEQYYDQKWPTEPDGRYYDVSHIIPLADGGANDVTNIEPIKHSDHIQMHMDNGDYVRWGGRRNIL